MKTFLLFMFALVLGYKFGRDSNKIDGNGVIENNNQDKQKNDYRKELNYIGAKEIEIEYSDMEGRKSKRKIYVLDVYQQNDTTYIHAFCHLRNEPRKFRLEQISKMYIEDAEIASPKDYFAEKIKD